MNWNPSPKDVAQLCEVFDSFVTENYQSGADECCYCGYVYRNAALWPDLKRGQENYDLTRLPHNQDCPVLIARDVATGIENAEQK